MATTRPDAKISKGVRKALLAQGLNLRASLLTTVLKPTPKKFDGRPEEIEMLTLTLHGDVNKIGPIADSV
ncbi:hypothetical protein [Granulicella sp. dw_53]|uniref:hypothetical protein n=1 Tax=Granulicella sp. dw_53 TaxID=2719792 RepID=UPI001BD23BD1|nr:hypothetical protein [Granulicella sp. dw_53]